MYLLSLMIVVNVMRLVFARLIWSEKARPWIRRAVSRCMRNSLEASLQCKGNHFNGIKVRSNGSILGFKLQTVASKVFRRGTTHVSHSRRETATCSCWKPSSRANLHGQRSARNQATDNKRISHANTYKIFSWCKSPKVLLFWRRHAQLCRPPQKDAREAEFPPSVSNHVPCTTMPFMHKSGDAAQWWRRRLWSQSLPRLSPLPARHRSATDSCWTLRDENHPWNLQMNERSSKETINCNDDHPLCRNVYDNVETDMRSARHNENALANSGARCIEVRGHRPERKHHRYQASSSSPSSLWPMAPTVVKHGQTVKAKSYCV